MKTSPKLEQFLKELNALTERYQYVLKPTLQFSEQGIFPQLSVVDKIPEPLLTPAVAAKPEESPGEKPDVSKLN